MTGVDLVCLNQTPLCRRRHRRIAAWSAIAALSSRIESTSSAPLSTCRTVARSSGGFPMRPGAGRRDQVPLRKALPSTSACFDAARHGSPGSGGRNLPEVCDCSRASMRPDATRQDQVLLVQTTNASMQPDARESSGSARQPGAIRRVSLQSRNFRRCQRMPGFNEARRDSPGSDPVTFSFR